VTEIIVESDNVASVFAALRGGIGDGIRDLLPIGEASAKAHAPVRTGALKAGIHTDDSHVDSELLGTIESAPDLEYPLYQELGTYKMAANPHMLPAGNDVAKQTESTMANAINAKLGGL
jgi:hypothetical protein